MPLNARASAHLDLIRGVSAIAVLAGHVRGMFLVDYQQLAFPSPFLKVVYALTGLGHQAVMVFFVLSGFFVGGSVLDAVDRWNWRRYLVNRGSRLYLVLLPALLLTTVSDYVAYRLPAGHIYFDHPIAHFNSQPISLGRSLPALVGNAAFLQNVLVPVFGSDAPLWSLANEFWYYLLFPALVLALWGGQSRAHRYACGAFAAIAGALVWQMILPGFLVWLFGTAVRALPAVSLTRLTRRVCIGISVSLFAVVLGFSRIGRLSLNWTDLFVGASFTLWLYCMVRVIEKKGDERQKAAPHYAQICKILAGCSYSVYAVHYPLVIFLRCSAGTQKWLPTPGSLSLGLGVCVLLFLIGFVFSRLTEARTDAVRKRLLAMVERRTYSHFAAVT